jgi:hypothetical protein
MQDSRSGKARLVGYACSFPLGRSVLDLVNEGNNVPYLRRTLCPLLTSADRSG